MTRTKGRLLALTMVAGMLGVACSSGGSSTTGSGPEPSASAMEPEMVTSDTGAAALRTTLNTLLQEHVYLAASATGAALGGRTEEFDAAAATLDESSVALGDAVSSVYGDDAGAQFLELWRSHIGMFVDYTTGVATKDMAKQEKAVADLQGYTEDFGAFLASANPNLTKDAVAGLVLEHVLGLKDAVDAQAAGKAGEAYTKLREAAGHMSMIGDALAGAIVAQFPEKFAE
jgi:hypothetical protein